MNAVTGPIQSLDLFDANVVALSNEVATVPSPGDFLGTNVLTFDTVNTGLNEQFVLQMLEANDIQFQDSSAARPGLEPEGDIRAEDFEQRIGGSGVFAMGWVLVENNGDGVLSWEVAGLRSLAVTVRGRFENRPLGGANEC